MDRSLRSYLQQADDTHEYLEKYFVGLTGKQIEGKIHELQASIKTLQTVAYQLANVSNIATRSLRNKKHIPKAIDPYPSEYDPGTLRSQSAVDVKELISGITIPVKTVDNVGDIPTSHIYYVNKLKQYAINIEGIIIQGNLGNIVEYKVNNSAACEYGSSCKSFTKNITCPYYHPPSDYISLNKPVPDDNIKNFTVGSWIYSKTKTPKTYFTRHIGSKDRLIYDLNTLKKVQYRDEISNREGQLIHDLMIYMILNSRGLLERHVPWLKRVNPTGVTL